MPTGLAFLALNEDNARVGFHTLWENDVDKGDLFLNVKAFDATHKAKWFNRLYGVAPINTTPLPDAIYRIGEYFSNSGNSGLPGAADPLDPVTGRCQRNYHLLSTDGYWNIALGAAGVGDHDRTVPGSLPGPIVGFTPGSPFPRPYYEGGTASSNSLADLSMRYWINDIRPDFANNVQDATAPWQHVTLYGLSIGARGSVDAAGLAAITAGTKDWPKPLGTGGTDSIDDLWHAALNSRGKYFNAENPQQLAESIVSCVGRLRRPQRYGHRYRARGCADHGHQEFRLPDELRLPMVGRRPEVRARCQDGRAACRRRGQSAQQPGVVGPESARHTGARHGMGYGPPHSYDRRFEDCGAIPARRVFPRRSGRRSMPVGLP